MILYGPMILGTVQRLNFYYTESDNVLGISHGFISQIHHVLLIWHSEINLSSYFFCTCLGAEDPYDQDCLTQCCRIHVSDTENEVFYIVGTDVQMQYLENSPIALLYTVLEDDKKSKAEQEGL